MCGGRGRPHFGHLLKVGFSKKICCLRFSWRDLVVRCLGTAIVIILSQSLAVSSLFRNPRKGVSSFEEDSRFPPVSNAGKARLVSYTGELMSSPDPFPIWDVIKITHFNLLCNNLFSFAFSHGPKAFPVNFARSVFS
jgi:hypothetical protein